MVLSVTEKAYLYESLSAVPPLRPDGRAAHQFRPVELFTDFLPTSNGSSKIVASDGSECIVSVKAKVVDHTVDNEFLVVDVDIAGHRDDSQFVLSIGSILTKVLTQQLEQRGLQLTRKYSFKLFIDVLVLSSYSHPLSLISFAIYAALNSTYLPKLISSDDDLDVAELPLFHDYDLEKLDVRVPLLFTVAFVGNNVLIDPASNESDVANNGLVVTWSNGKIGTPIMTIGLNDDNVKGFGSSHIRTTLEMIEKCAPQVVKALDGI